MSKRKREPATPKVPKNHMILALIEESEMYDIGYAIVEAALRSEYHKILRGVWSLGKASVFWSRFIHRLLPSTLFARLDSDFDAIRAAYRTWPLKTRGEDDKPVEHNFPWHNTNSRYLANGDPLRIFRPFFVLWSKARFPDPVPAKEQEEIKTLVNRAFGEGSWCGRALLGLHDHNPQENFPELNMSRQHVFVAMARIMQISFRLASAAIVPILCVMDHSESIPFLLFYLASCSMNNQWATEESNRQGLEYEVIDTAFINKYWKRAREYPKDSRFSSVLMPIECLR